MNLKLKSDFIDYYDHWFDLNGNVFERFSRSGMNRREMFAFLKEKGERTPRVGTLKQLLAEGVKKVVVYLDEMAHRAEGKILLLASDAAQEYPDHLCSEFIENPDQIVCTTRRLQVGDQIFWLQYTSDDAWRSNFGTVEIKIIKHETSLHPSIHHPLFAIDYVHGEAGRYAIDFNIAPQIKGTGIEEVLPPKKVVELIKSHYQIS